MESRRSFSFRSLLLGAAWLAMAAAGCVHLPPTVKAEMERAVPPADNNFVRAAGAPPPQAHASN